ncbi:MAG: Na/Pi cotransporter family protein [Bacteroidales bacterium]|nr:Na/Pi cotransporter family protein [Bacteroidales bacterium]
MLLQILTLLGSLAMFLYGMSLMSGGLQKMAGNRMRVFMAKMTSNNFKCILTGIVVTAMVQSSTATTLMIVSFVNAGLLALGRAIAVIMGANIGTTVTAWIFALSFGGGSWSIATIAIPLMFFAFVAMSIKKYSNLGEFLMGFALLFLGLATLKETSTVLLDNEGVRVFLATLSGHGIWSIFIYMLAGAVITLMLQSSATATAITMLLVAQGYIPFTMATAMVLGSNLGTTVTSNIAATVANLSAKRTARAHFLFNLFGVILTLLFFKPFLGLVGLSVAALGFPNPVTIDFATADAETQASLVSSLPYSVAVLHTVFNVITTLILVWFIPQLEKMVTLMVPQKGDGKESYRLKYIGGLSNIGTGDIALNSAKMEVVEFGRLCRKDLEYIRMAVNAKTQNEFEEADKKLIHYEDITDNIERDIAVYLREVSKHELSVSGMSRVREFYRIIGEMESLGDSGETVGKIMARVWDHEGKFTEHMLSRLNHMIDLVDEAYVAMDYNLSTPIVEIEEIRNADEAEKAINEYRDRLRNEHLSNIEKSSYPYETGSFYMDIVNTLEKMGDFIINISQSVMGAKAA